MTTTDRKPLTGKELYRRILQYTKQYWLALTIGILGNALYSGVDASLTYFLKPVLDKGFIGKDYQFLSMLPFLVLGIFIARGIANFLGSYYMASVARSVVMRMRQDIFKHLLRVPASYYDNSSAGQILSAVIYNVEQVAKVSAGALTDLLQSGFLVVGLLFVMFKISWQLSLIYFATVPLIAIFVKVSSKYTRRINHGIQAGMGKITSIAEESIVGYRVVRAFGGEAYESGKFEVATEDNRRRELSNVIVRSLSTSFVQIIAAIGLAIILYMATSNHHTALKAGGFVALIASMLAILKPLKILTTVNSTIQGGLAGAQAVFALLDEEEEKDTGTESLTEVRGDLVYENINFTYPATEKQVLFDINFTVKQGEIVALVGRSGSGKSTVASLLSRFYDCQQGAIKINGRDTKEYTLASLRRQMATVSQHVTLFNDTVAKNVAYGVFSEADEVSIMAALKAAHAWEFVKDFPQGIHTLVGENGVLLSGGQRQRLAIARAIFKDAPILILDEATSALDTESERYIQAALDELIKGRTTIVIAHRLSTIENANRIIVLDKGHVVESGSHHELLAKQGYYTKLHSMQFQLDHVMMTE